MTPFAKGFLAGMPAGLGALVVFSVAWALVKEEQGRRDRERATFKRMT